MLNQEKTKLICLKIGFLILFLTFLDVNIVCSQPDIVQNAYYGSSYGLFDDSGNLNSLIYEYDYVVEEYFLKVKKINIDGNILFEKKLNISKGYDYFPMREKLYDIIDDNDYVFSVEEEDPYKLYLIITSNNCSEFTKILLSNSSVSMIDVIMCEDEAFYIVFSSYGSSYLYKMDCDGYVIWKKVYLKHSYSSGITNIIKTIDNNIMHSINSSIYKVISNGDIISTIEIDNYVGEDKSIRDFILLSDDSILIFYTDDGEYWKASSPSVIKLDLMGNKIFDIEYSDEKYEIFDYDNDNLFETIEGGFILILRTGLFADQYYSIKNNINGAIEWDINDRLLYQDNDGFYYSVGLNSIVIYGPDYPLLKIVSPFGFKSGEARYLIDSNVIFEIYPDFIEENGTRASFMKWESKGHNGYNGTDNPASIIIENNLVELAVWDVDYFIDFECKNGFLNVSDGWFKGNDSIVVEAVSEDNFEFVGWDVPQNCISYVDGPMIEIVVCSPIIVSASFRENVRYLEIQSDYGDTSGAGQYQTGELVSFEVSPSVTYSDTKHVFHGWVSNEEQGYVGSDNPAYVRLDSNITQIARWDTFYYVEIISENGGCVPDYTDWYEVGSKLAVSVIPDSGYVFEQLFDEKSGIIINEPNIELEIDKPYKLVAKFSKEGTSIPSFSLFSILWGLIISYLIVSARAGCID